MASSFENKGKQVVDSEQKDPARNQYNHEDSRGLEGFRHWTSWVRERNRREQAKSISYQPWRWKQHYRNLKLDCFQQDLPQTIPRTDHQLDLRGKQAFQKIQENNAGGFRNSGKRSPEWHEPQEQAKSGLKAG